MPKKKIVFVCSGGGAKGSFEAGVLKQLALNGIIPNAIYGTSTGAMNSAGYAFVGIENLLKVWRGIKSINDVMKQRFFLFLPYYLLITKQKGVYSMDPLANKLEDIISAKNLDTTDIESVVCRVSLKTSKKDYVSSNNIHKSPTGLSDFRTAVLASASTPIMNDVVDGEWVDGGVRAIAPLAQAIKDGATDIYVIMGEPYSPDCIFTGEVGNVIDVFNRTIGSMVQEMLWDDIHQCDIYNKNGIGRKIKLTVYAPDVSLIGADEFDPVKIEASIQQGLKCDPVFTSK